MFSLFNDNVVLNDNSYIVLWIEQTMKNAKTMHAMFLTAPKRARQSKNALILLRV